MTESRPLRSVERSKLPVGLLSAPFQVGVSILSVVVAVGFLATANDLAAAPVSVLQVILTPPWVWIWGAFLGGGGIATLVGLFGRGTRALAVEVVGLCLMGSAWAVYGLALALETSASIIPIGFAVIASAASIVRVRALLISSRISAQAGSSRVPEE